MKQKKCLLAMIGFYGIGKMRKIIFSMVVVLLIGAMLLSGCDSAADDPSLTESGTESATGTDTTLETKDLSSFDVTTIQPNCKVSEAADLLGRSYGQVSSAVHPIVYMWALDEERKLYIQFETDDFDEFWGRFLDGEYTVSDVAEWIQNYEARYAYVVQNGDETVLFDVR